MSEHNLGQVVDKELQSWFSTYGLITIERIFAQYGLKIQQEQVHIILRDPESIYHLFLQIPFRNILNGIILNQASDYRGFLQKLFIDYLVSGAANEADAPLQGGAIRESLEEERGRMISLSDEFDIDHFKYEVLISESQKDLIKLAKNNFSKMDEVTDEDKTSLVDIVKKYELMATELNEKLCDYRKKFQELIILVQNLVTKLPNYQLDPNKMFEHKESINFDPNLGFETIN